MPHYELMNRYLHQWANKSKVSISRPMTSIFICIFYHVNHHFFVYSAGLHVNIAIKYFQLKNIDMGPRVNFPMTSNIGCERVKDEHTA